MARQKAERNFIEAGKPHRFIAAAPAGAIKREVVCHACERCRKTHKIHAKAADDDESVRGQRSVQRRPRRPPTLRPYIENEGARPLGII